MDKMYNIHEAKTNFSKIAEEVEAGAEIIVARAGKPIMRLVKYDEQPVKLKYGAADHLMPDWTDEEWEQLDEKISASFAKDN